MINKMKTIKVLLVFLNLILFNFPLLAQDLEVIVHETFLFDTLGVQEIVFDFEIINVSADTQIVFEVRTRNDLPPDWTSSLCFGELCFSPNQDSVATTPQFSTPAPGPGDTVFSSLHVIPMNNNGTAYVQIQIGTFRNPNVRDTIDFIATTDPTLNVEDEFNLSSYELAQNYPNPFNPLTQINYNVGEGGLVNLKVYNILGIEVATLVNEYKPAGSYQATFDGNDLSSGVYIYNLSVNNYTKTRKMILEK